MFLSPLFILAVIVCILLIDGIALAGATIEENTLCDHDRGLRKGKKSGSSSAEPRSDFPLVSPEHKKRKPSWWRIYKKYMKKHHSISLKNCAVPETVEPTTGMKCQKPKRDSYFCMFGEQRCESNQVKGKKHPAVLCECQSDETLKCDDWKPCISDEAVTKDQVTTCPGEDEAPKTGYVCNWVPEMECSYGEFCCCNGPCFPVTRCTCELEVVDCEPLPIPRCPQCEPDVQNECPPIQPESGDTCLWFKQKCLFGKSCCCDGQCYEDIECTCTPSADETTGEVTCNEIPITCPTCEECPSDQPESGDTCLWFDQRCLYGKSCCCDGQCYEDIECTCTPSADGTTGEVTCESINVVCTGCDEDVLPEIHGQKCQGEGIPEVVQVGQDCSSCCGYCLPEFECRCAEGDGRYDCEKLYLECECPASSDKRCPDAMPTSGVSCDSSGGTFVCQYGAFTCACLDGSFDCQPRCWPDLINQPADGAKERIGSENPDLAVFLVKQGDIVTMDYRLDRVRIFYDEDGIVAEIPCVG